MDFYPPFTCRKDTVIFAGDRCAMTVAIVDASGSPVSLVKEVNGSPVFQNLVWIFRSRMKFPRSSTYTPMNVPGSGLVFTTADYLKVDDYDKGYVTVDVPSGFFNDTDTYDHWLSGHWPGESPINYITHATGEVNVKGPQLSQSRL